MNLDMLTMWTRQKFTVVLTKVASNKHVSREAPRLPAQSVCIHPLQRHHRVFSEQLFYVEFLYYTFCLPKAGTELDLSAGSGGGHRCHLLERHLQEAYSRGKKESPETTLWLSWPQNTQLPSSREAWQASMVNVTGMSCLPRTGAVGLSRQPCGVSGHILGCVSFLLASLTCSEILWAS